MHGNAGFLLVDAEKRAPKQGEGKCTLKLVDATVRYRLDDMLSHVFYSSVALSVSLALSF